METDPATTTFAQVLARTRAAAGLTQEELAERAELSVRAVSNLERGEASRPRRGTIDRLAAALGLTGGDARRFTDVARGRPVRDHDPDAAPAVDGPAQLPTDLPDFTGRADELTRLADLLSGDHAGVRIVVLGGGGGVGKTSLAVRVAHALRHRYPDGQLYTDLAGSRTEEVDPGTALAGFLAALGEAAPGDGDDLDRRAARYRSVLAGRRVLVVLDDARDAAQVRPLLPAGPGSAVLVTSRNRLPDLAGARHLIVGELAGPDATELFARIAGPERAAREPGATARVVAACDRLPLAVRIAGARLAVRPAWSVAALADRLTAARGTLDELRAGDLAVRGSFRLSYDRLTTSSARLFALLGHWPGHDLGVPVAAALADIDESTAERLLERLVDAHLLESPAPGRYRQHDLLHAFAGELLADEVRAATSEAALRRLFSYLTAAAYEADLALWPASGPPFPAESVADPRAAPFAGYDAAMAWYAAEWPSL
ncbi:MAG TPA: helix-turn-helix domain-containing protein, partial [Actinocatenispora sp.]